MNSNFVQRLWQDVLAVFCSQYRIQFAAPWRARQRGC